jgi:hypothetical protein
LTGYFNVYSYFVFIHNKVIMHYKVREIPIHVIMSLTLVIQFIF